MQLTDKPIDEVTLRLYEIPSGITGRDLIRKICLSFGLLQPNDSRNIIIDVLWNLIIASKQKKWISSKEIEMKVVEFRKIENISISGTASSNIRRILKLLKDKKIIERKKSKYRIINFAPAQEVFEKSFRERLEKIISRNKTYLKLV